MPWKKHLKKASEIRESNRQMDLDTMEKFDQLLKDVKDSENVVGLEFLKEFLRLRPEDDAAMEELKIKMTEIGDIKYFSIIDDNDQSIYLGFTSMSDE